jgi:predicted DCC family thiol-disulfide oxidoreductase YuxK
VRPGGRVHSGGSAFEPLLRELRGGSALATLAERFPAAAERGYRWVAAHRSTFGLLTPARVRRWADARIDSSR